MSALRDLVVIATLVVTIVLRNVSGKERCPFCDNCGWVVFARRHDSPRPHEVDGALGRCPFCSDEMAPCPACEVGLHIEFPLPDKDGRERVGNWGPEGFWRGRRLEAPRQLAMGEVAATVEKGAPPPPELLTLFSLVGLAGLERIGPGSCMDCDRELGGAGGLVHVDRYRVGRNEFCEGHARARGEGARRVGVTA